MIKKLLTGMFKGATVLIGKGQKFIDVYKITIETKEGTQTIYEQDHITIFVEGDCEEVKTVNGDIFVEGEVGEVKTTNGDVTVHKDVKGRISTTNGDISVGGYNGSASTRNGRINIEGA